MIPNARPGRRTHALIAAALLAAPPAPNRLAIGWRREPPGCTGDDNREVDG